MADDSKNKEQPVKPDIDYTKKYLEFSHQTVITLKEGDPSILLGDKGYVASIGLGANVNVGKQFILVEKNRSPDPLNKKKEMQAKHSKNGNILCIYEFKIHISLNETNPLEFAIGWNIVKSILIDFGVAYFKVVRYKNPFKHGHTDPFINMSMYVPNQKTHNGKITANEVDYANSNPVKPS